MGLEPTRKQYPQESETCASANSATSAYSLFKNHYFNLSILLFYDAPAWHLRCPKSFFTWSVKRFWPLRLFSLRFFLHRRRSAKKLPIPPHPHIHFFKITISILVYCFSVTRPRDTCGAQNLFSLGAWKDFDRCVFLAFAFSSTGGARLKNCQFRHIRILNLLNNNIILNYKSQAYNTPWLFGLYVKFILFINKDKLNFIPFCKS